jgi:hypothetical protein
MKVGMNAGEAREAGEPTLGQPFVNPLVIPGELMRMILLPVTETWRDH